VVQNKTLLFSYISIGLQHFLFTATFFALPFLVRNLLLQGGLQAQWHFYFPLLLLSFVLLFPCLRIVEKKRQERACMQISTFLILIVQLLFLYFLPQQKGLLFLLMLGYLLPFNLLEALLPSFASKKAPKEYKGAAMGVYSTFQFLGIFVGGAFAGIAYKLGCIEGIFLMNAVVGLFWVVITSFWPFSKE
jgi:predicted MFS family arabinose efflux permease